MIRVGIIGYGYWGPHIARNFHAADDCEVSVICDKSPAAQGGFNAPIQVCAPRATFRKCCLRRRLTLSP